MYDTFHANIEEKDPAAIIATMRGDDRPRPHQRERPRHARAAATSTGTRPSGPSRRGYDGWLTIEAFGRALPALAAGDARLARPLPRHRHALCGEHRGHQAPLGAALEGGTIMNETARPIPAADAGARRALDYESPAAVPLLSTIALATADGELNRELHHFLFDPPSNPDLLQGQDDRHLLHQRRRGGGDPGAHPLAHRARRHGARRVAAASANSIRRLACVFRRLRHPRPGDPAHGERRLAQDRPISR